MKLSILTFVLFFGICLPMISFSQTATPDPNKIAADQAECQQQATTASGYNSAAAPPPPPPAGDPAVYTKSFNDCMLSRGYIPQS